MNELKRMHEMEWFADRVTQRRYQISEHVVRYLMAREITVADIEATLLTGSVLEEHRHEIRGSSYLVYGASGGRPVHVMCADGNSGWLVVLFAYVPKSRT
jgi:hypothetical protein